MESIFWCLQTVFGMPPYMGKSIDMHSKFAKAQTAEKIALSVWARETEPVQVSQLLQTSQLWETKMNDL